MIWKTLYASLQSCIYKWGPKSRGLRVIYIAINIL